MLSFNEALKEAKILLEKHHKETRIASLLLEDMFQMDRVALMIRGTEIISDKALKSYHDAVERVIADYPYQYITGLAHFYGRTFKVNSHTLIPRNETEELVYHVLRKVKSGRIVDIGTGTGAIGLTLKLENKALDVYVTDISSDALLVTKQNMDALDAKVTILNGDMLKPLTDKNIKVDVLISNPPYIAESETDVMSESTVKYEPHSALFAEEDGLYFYRHIIEGLESVLNTDGKVFFEIGYKQGEKVKDLFLSNWPKSKVQVIKDINGQDRIIYAEWVK